MREKKSSQKQHVMLIHYNPKDHKDILVKTSYVHLLGL